MKKLSFVLMLLVVLLAACSTAAAPAEEAQAGTPIRVIDEPAEAPAEEKRSDQPVIVEVPADAEADEFAEPAESEEDSRAAGDSGPEPIAEAPPLPTQGRPATGAAGR